MAPKSAITALLLDIPSLPRGVSFPITPSLLGVPGKAVATRDCGDANLVNAKFYSAMAESYANGEDRLSKEKVDEVLGSIGRLSLEPRRLSLLINDPRRWHSSLP